MTKGKAQISAESLLCHFSWRLYSADFHFSLLDLPQQGHLFSAHSVLDGLLVTSVLYLLCSPQQPFPSFTVREWKTQIVTKLSQGCHSLDFIPLLPASKALLSLYHAIIYIKHQLYLKTVLSLGNIHCFLEILFISILCCEVQVQMYFSFCSKCGRKVTDKVVMHRDQKNILILHLKPSFRETVRTTVRKPVSVSGFLQCKI